MTDDIGKITASKAGTTEYHVATGNCLVAVYFKPKGW